MHTTLHRGSALFASAALLAGALVASSSVAASAADPNLAEGPTWTVDRAAGGFEVTVDLAKPLPIRSDAPTIVVDGESVGIATESADGRSLSVFTTDPAVVSADSVSAGWASESAGTSAPSKAVEVPEAAVAQALAANPSEQGDFDWTESIYKFGDQAIPLAAIGGVRGELEGKIYLPTTGGARPTVVLLHGRHSSCYGTGPSNPLRWPCATAPDNTDRKSIPSYAGYDGTARALASNGYAVVSISANAINSNDNQLASDQGAQARGQLLLDTLTMLDDASAGRPVTYYDAWTDRDLTLEQALVEGSESYAVRSEGFIGGAPPLDTVTAANLVGRFDLTTIGMMGHSRGGEGVTSAATLNQGLEDPWDIESILPLAPVDFGRMTVPDVPMNVILPYCDGDVSNQQGQHMLDDSRYAFDDDVLRSGTWAMGANHNFYNTVWTPGRYAYSVSDDWSGSTARRTEPICGTDPTVAATSIRMTPQEQYDMGTAYMAGWFRLTLGGDDEFLPMFDGTGEVPEVLGDEDIRTQATAPASARSTLTTFEETSPLVRTSGTATAAPCASLAGRTTPQTLPPCATTLASGQVPHWTPASNGGNVPATPVTRMIWTSETGEVRVSVPTGQRDAGGFERLAVKVAADETVTTGTDLTMTVVDGAGATWSSLVSELNPVALVRMPTSATTAAASTLKKVVLQQVVVPTADLATAGLSLTDVREVRFTAATGADGTPNGAAYLSDLAFENSSVGTAVAQSQPQVNVYAPNRVEGDAPDIMEVATYLEEPADVPVTGYVSVLGSATSRAGAAMEKVTFAPGETCLVVSAAVQGDTLPSNNNGSTLKASVINTSGGVMGQEAIVFTTISEDDGFTDPAVSELPAYGTPGPVCEELASVLETGTITVDGSVEPGGSVEVTSAGYRAGEAVTFSGEGLESVTVEADGEGVATATIVVPAEAPLGTMALTALGEGTGRTATGELSVLGDSTTTLEIDPEVPSLREPVTLTATVEADDTAGTVEFFDGETSLGTATTTDGVATLEVPGFGAGEHSLTAVFGPTEVSGESTSAPITFVLDRRSSTLVLGFSPSTTVFGTPATLVAAVEDAAQGEVELTVGGETVTVTLDDEGRLIYPLSRLLPVGSYAITAQYLGSDDDEPSEVTTAGLTVARKSTVTRINAPKAVSRGAKMRVRVRIGGRVPGAAATGRVVLQAKGQNLNTRRIGRPNAAGVVTFQVRAARGGKKMRLSAVYQATGNYQGSTAPVKVVRVKRR